MQDDYVLLNRQLHTFRTEELQELRRISEVIFEPLMRPFRQKRKIQEFSFSKSLRVAQKIGAFMPTYERVEREHRKSRLVIAMSLAGIDRCSGVSLIPLFSSLKETALDFNFYVYTDDLIKAEFTPDGFLANDYQIAWNHVAGPVVMQRLVDLETESQEDILLIIDSLGGGFSRWYEQWGYDQRAAVREEQDKYLSVAGKYSYYTRVRKELDGDYSKVSDISFPKDWFKRVENNTKLRWMETPALQEYMIRWVFNPQFGTVRHGRSPNYTSAFEIAQKLRGKFRQIHLLTPNNQGSHRYTLERFLRTNVVDYHHQVNTIYGFATVLANIVHGQCPFDGPFTKKVSYEIVKFSEFKGEDDEDIIDDTGDDSGEHSNLVSTGKCFGELEDVVPNAPDIYTIKLEKRTRGTSSLQDYELSLNEVDLSEFIPPDLTASVFWSNLLPVDFEIENGDSEYTRVRKAEEVIDTIVQNQIVFKQNYGFMGLVREKRPVVSHSLDLDTLLRGIEYEKHHTSTLQKDVESFLLMLSPVYHSYLSHLALKHVIWCGVSQYNQRRRAISVNPKQPIDGRKRSVWHELGHYLESTCSPVGMFSNELLRQKGGMFDKKKLIQVGGGGEWAMPVTNGSADWIKPYAGKWYKRIHPQLPNETEIISVHSEFFKDTECLIQLIKHDPNMVRFMAFVYMGGPVAAMKAVQDLKQKEALRQINQRERKGSGFSKGRRSGRGGRGGSYRGKIDHGFGL